MVSARLKVARHGCRVGRERNFSRRGFFLFILKEKRMKRKRDGKRLKRIERVKVRKIQMCKNGIEGGRKRHVTFFEKIDRKKKRYIEKHNLVDSGCFHV